MQLLAGQRLEVQMEATLSPNPVGSPAPLSRAQRAHYRLCWAERLVRNARAPAANQVMISLFGVPESFATSLGLAIGCLDIPSPRTSRLARVEPHRLFSWLSLDSSYLLPFSFSIPQLLPPFTCGTSSSAMFSPTRSGISSSSTSLRKSWDIQARRAARAGRTRLAIAEELRELARDAYWFWNFFEDNTTVRVVRFEPGEIDTATWSLSGIPVAVGALLYTHLWSK